MNPPTKTQLRAVAKVKAAIERGELEPGACESCGRGPFSEKGKRCVDAHHDDYAKPLDVRWMCRKCHQRHHHLNGPGENRGNDLSIRRRGRTLTVCLTSSEVSQIESDANAAGLGRSDYIRSVIGLKPAPKGRPKRQ